MKPLEGILVVEFTHAAAGPLCGMMLADFGATVIKVEKPGRGDGSRYMSMDRKFADAVVGGDYYLSLNRNKQSIAIDMSMPEGRDLIRELARKADVFVENFRPGTLDKHGVGWNDLHALNARLIYCGISAFGRGEGEIGEAGMDIVVQARAGTISITGDPDGPPAKPGVSIADMSGGLQATIGILLALQARNLTGRGQMVDVSLMDSTLMMLSNYAVGILNSDAQLTRLGTGHPQLCPYQAFKSGDGEWVFIGAGTNALYRKLCQIVRREELAQDPRFAKNQDRVFNRAELVPMLQAALESWTAEDLMKALTEASIPCSLLNDPKSAYLEAKKAGKGIVATVQHPLHGELALPGISINLSETPGEVRDYPPGLGEHSFAILKHHLQLSEEQCEALKAAGAIDQIRVGGARDGT